MYRTDKQFMKNPATAPSRIYIGGLPKVVIADDLDSKFSKHGNILGLVINQGFAFVQYNTENEAQAAIKAENGTMMMGRKIIVRQAFPPKANKDIGPPPLNQGPSPFKPDTPQGKGIPSLIPPSGESDRINFEPPDHKADMQDNMDTGPNSRTGHKFDMGRDRGVRGGRGGGGVGAGPKSRDRFEPARDLFPERDNYYFMDKYNAGPPPPEVALPPSEKNDCEIIVVSRTLTEYAEFIESRLKQLGLVVDLLFPNEDVPIGRVLANISSRGCLYAILVMPQNEEHRSLTLNILHTIPQEHRNMPLDDALILISRNFEAYMRGEELKPVDPNKPDLADRHPQPIQMLINLLAENRMLTSSQYDRILKYLQERKDLQYEHEVAEGVTQDSNESVSKQTELQSRILNILNKNPEPVIPTSITAPEPVAKDSSAPILKDPTVQKALDSILSGDMFKAIAGNI